MNAKNRRLSNQVFENSHQDDDDDEDVIILEENSTPKPAGDDDTEVKLQQSPMEQSGVEVEPVGDSEPCGQTGSTGTSTSQCDQGTTTATQTEVPSLVVKKEETVSGPISRMIPCGTAGSCIYRTFTRRGPHPFNSITAHAFKMLKEPQ